MIGGKVQKLVAKMIREPNARPRMVEWFNPAQLIVTGFRTVLSTVFGRYSDYRLIEAFNNQHAEQINDYAKEYMPDGKGGYMTDADGFYMPNKHQDRDEIWIDYVCDVGDGFNSTYSVAYALTQPELTLQTEYDVKHKGAKHTTKRGDILIFGGDQVYPTANSETYIKRLIAPYHIAQGFTGDPHPHVFAIPGNHDWYDGLIAFSRIFAARKWFNGWQSPQRRSYFALKLPHGWWLLGTDIQLNSDIDEQQVRYFEQVAEQIDPSERVILCNAEPYWVYKHKYKDYDPVYNENNLAYLEKMLKKRHIGIHVYLAGDSHHYRRFEYVPTQAGGKDDHSLKIEKITAGGGGAFLHPTHDIHDPFIPEIVFDDEEPLQFDRKMDFPSESESRRLTKQNFLFAWKNPLFGIVTAILYLLLCSSIQSEHTYPSSSASYAAIVSSSWTEIGRSPSAFIWTFIVLAGFWLFTDTHSRVYKWIAGPLHGAIHVAASFFIGCGAVYLASSGFHLAWGFGALLLSGILIAYGGWIIGSIIMGIYLYISLNWFGRHANEAFSAIQNENYKNFLRIHIAKNGDLTIYPVGIRTITRKWKQPAQRAEFGPMLEPDVPAGKRAATEPHLIEEPICIPSVRSH
ncbi:metallophosphoesterase [Paenibacillus albus]|uniref:Metallophosphoesterase n=1 Tax=Paenibacillus albus TaxID=2495582 RepID=A0A3Q8X6A7_9BACL|nr:metallophosphoesterase [Paenibacillus albus]AZN41157.1 metallophosphoesterase [Paenibacillus albus]